MLPSRTEIAMRVKGILSEQLAIAPSELPEYARWDGTGADTLDAVEALDAIEEAFEIDFTEEELMPGCQQMATVGQIIDCVEGAVRAKGLTRV